MPEEKPFYITTTLPYVNAEPHVGHALEFIRADVIARSKNIQGFDVFFNTGTDEHGVKIYTKAKQEHIEPQAYVDKAAAKFKEILPLLGISSDVNFIRTTDASHIKSAQAFWQLVDKNGFIYKKDYSVKYCVGCELEKTDSELVDGRCPLHPLQDLEIINEENYFFKFSAFQQKLLDLYKSRPDFVIPGSRLNEIRSFVERGLEDFSISRLASKMPWGIPVPGDDKQVMYVWFDALVNYISAVGWPHDMKAFEKWWNETGGVVQYCGKDNLRQQSAMWQAMLMAAGISPSKQIIIDGFVTGEGGVKMSKSLGNTVDPLELVKEYGTDALRYYVVRELAPFEDSPFTADKFKEAYNASLANGIGNLTSRIMKMAEANLKPVRLPKVVWPKEFVDAISRYDLKAAADSIWAKIQALDALIQKEEPFKKVKDESTKKHALEIIEKLVIDLAEVAALLEPMLPSTSEAIMKCVEVNKVPAAPLFLRK